MKLDELLELAIARNASDLLLSPGRPVSVRVQGVMSFLGDTPLSPELCRRVLGELVSAEMLARFDEHLELDFSVVRHARRFRGNAYVVDGAVGVALRLAPAEPPTPEVLRLPPVLLEMMQRPQGLILSTGATGQGKSTTQASLLAWLARNASKHVVTIEDPVEQTIPQGRSVIEQREVGRDTRSFLSALRHVVRARPDVVMVGEMRDLETIRSVLTLAETGHLVLSTLHTGDAAMAVPRIVEAFPESAQALVRQQLAASLLGVVNQRLVRRRDGSQVGAFEVLVQTPAIARLIRDGHEEQIVSAMEIDQRSGSKTLNRALSELVDAGEIDPHEMERHALRRESRPASQAPPRS